MSGLPLTLVVALAHCPLLAAARSEAPDEVASGEAVAITLGVEAAIGGFISDGANFGADRIDMRDEDVSGDPTWSEGYLKPTMGAELALDSAGTFYCSLSAVAAFTGGDGDPAGYTRSGDGKVSVETAFLGWRLGELLFEGWEADTLDISYGRQEFQVGDSFLIRDGDLDQFDKGAYWLAPRVALRQAGLLQLNGEPIRADVFYLESDRDQDDTELAGANLEYCLGDSGALGLMYLRVVASGTPNCFSARDGMDVFSVRVNDLQPGTLPGLAPWGEYVSERASMSWNWPCT